MTLTDEMARLWRFRALMNEAIATEDPLKASEYADDFYSAAYRNDYPRAGAYARRVLEATNAPELYREALSRALVVSDDGKMDEAVQGLATLIVSLEWQPKKVWAGWLDMLNAIARGRVHKSLFVAKTGERPNAIPPAARRAAGKALSRRRAYARGGPC